MRYFSKKEFWKRYRPSLRATVLDKYFCTTCTYIYANYRLFEEQPSLGSVVSQVSMYIHAGEESDLESEKWLANRPSYILFKTQAIWK